MLLLVAVVVVVVVVVLLVVLVLLVLYSVLFIQKTTKYDSVFIVNILLIFTQVLFKCKYTYQYS